jgi:hypothetical protein
MASSVWCSWSILVTPEDKFIFIHLPVSKTL